MNRANKSTAHRALSIVVAVCLAVGVSSAFLLNALAPRGEVHGTVRICDSGGRNCKAVPGVKLPFVRSSDICEFGGRYCTAVPGPKLPFVRSADNSTLTAVTDSKGWFSISLPAGRYSLDTFVDSGPRVVIVVPDQRVLADYEVWHLPQ
jgi:hypothetical protein